MASSLLNTQDNSINITSIYGMIRAQKLARKLKIRAVFLQSEKRRQENAGKIFIDHTDFPQAVEEASRPFIMQTNLSIPRYLTSNSKSPYGTTPSQLTSATQRPEVKINPELYKMEPKKRFYEPEVRNLIRDIFERSLRGKSYDPEASKSSAKHLCDTIKERVKSLGYTRYKIISFVYIGQLSDQGLRIASMCLIDKSVDNYAEFYYEGSDFFALGVVYGFYME